MKILVANKMDWKHPRAGGVEVNLRETLTRLSDRGHEIHLLTALYPGAPEREELEGVNIHRYGLSGRTNEIFILSAGQLYLNYLDRKLDPDILYTVNSISSWVSLTGKPHVSAVHHLYGRSIFGQFDFPVNLFGYITEAISTFLTGFRDIISVSPSTTENLVRRGIDRQDITEIVNGVDTELYTPGEEADRCKILYLGRLEHNKGVDFLPDIYRRLQDELDCDFNFEIAGFGRKKDVAVEMSEDEGDVIFHGHVSEDRKRQLLTESWVVIAPSRLEGWGMTVSEANASSTPVVGFETDGLRDSVQDGETGYLASLTQDRQRSVERLCRKVAELVSREDLRRRFGDEARELAESRSWEIAADTLEDLFRTKIEADDEKEI